MLIASGPGVAALQDYTAASYQDSVDITLNQGDTVSTMKVSIHDPLSSFPILMEDDIVALDETDPAGWPTCNLLLNPSLEAPFTSGVAQYWTLANGGSGVTAASSATAAFGAASQQITLADAANGTPLSIGQSIELPVSSENTVLNQLPYYFSVWMQSVTPLVAVTAILGIDWYADATYLSTASQDLTGLFSTGWSNWHRWSVNSTPPPSATQARVYLRLTPTSATNSGSVLLDGAQFEYATFSNAPINITLPLVANTISAVDPAPAPASQTGSSVGASTAYVAVASAGTTAQFVTATASGFQLNSLPFEFVGFDSYDLTVGYGMTAAQQQSRLQLLASFGVKVVRTWAFGETNQTSQPTYSYFQYGTTGQNFNENMFRLLDSAIAAAAQYGIRLILCCANNWGDYGGKPQYVAWYNTANGTSLAPDNFFDTAGIISHYKSFLAKLIGRTNTVTGVAYANDPTIMAWECVNEGRYGLGTDSNGNTLQSSHLAVMTSWYTTISSYIKTLDGNHLVSCGGLMQAYDYINNDPVHNGTGSYGIDFFTQTSISTIDYGDFHLYPAHNYVSAGSNCTLTWSSAAAYNAQLQQYMGWASSAGKPLMIGECGIDKRNSVTSPVVFDPRSQYFASVYSTMFAGHCSGVLLWNYNNTDNVDNSYGILSGVTYTDPTIAPGNTSDTALLNGVSAENAALAPTGSPPPPPSPPPSPPPTLPPGAPPPTPIPQPVITVLASQAQLYPSAYCDNYQPGCHTDSGLTNLYYRQRRLFAGFLKQATYDYTAGPERDIALDAAQYTVLLSEAPANLLIRAVTDQAAIAQVMAYAINQGFLVGVDYSTYVSSIIMVDSLTFSWQTSRDALNKIANMAVAAYWIDNYKYLHYQPDLAASAPFGVSDFPDYVKTFPFAAWQFSDDSTQTRTTEVYEGGTTVSLPVTFTFYGLATTTTAALNANTPYTSIPVTALTTAVIAQSSLSIGASDVAVVATSAVSGATAIAIESYTPGATIASGTAVTVTDCVVNNGNGVAQVDALTIAGVGTTVGYTGINQVSQGYGALIDLQSGTLTLSTTPANGVAIILTYRYPTPVIVRVRAVRAATSSAKRKIHTHTADSTVTSLDSAIARANADLNQYQKARPIGQLNVYSPPWPAATPLIPGTAIPITHAASGLNQQLFQIQQVDILLHAGVYLFTLKLGYYRPDFVVLAAQSQRFLAQAATQPTANQGDVLSEVLNVQDGWTITDSIQSPGTVTPPGGGGGGGPPSSVNVGTWGGPSTYGGSYVWG